MVLNVNLFRKIKQKGAFDADFLSSSTAGCGMTTRRYIVQPISKLLLPQWGCTARTLLVVRWQKHAHCSSVAYPGNQREPGHAPKGFRRHGHNEQCLHRR